jgi:hypothetical protein
LSTRFPKNWPALDRAASRCEDYRPCREQTQVKSFSR